MTKLRKPVYATAMAAAVAGAFSIAAYAAEVRQPTPFNPKAVAISTVDQAAITKATYEALERRAAGVSVTWAGAKSKTGPVTNANGTVKVLKVFLENGRPCAEVENVFTPTGAARDARPRHYVLEYCRLSDGIWKIAG